MATAFLRYRSTFLNRSGLLTPKSNSIDHTLRCHEFRVCVGLTQKTVLPLTSFVSNYAAPRLRGLPFSVLVMKKM